MIIKNLAKVIHFHLPLMVHITRITFFVFFPYSNVDKIVSDRCYLFIYFSIQFMTEKHRTMRCCFYRREPHIPHYIRA